MRHVALKLAAAAAILGIGALSMGAAVPDAPAAAPVVYEPSMPTFQLAQYYDQQYYGERHYPRCYQVCARQDYYGHCVAYRKVCE
jgi:hypothetical protein